MEALRRVTSWLLQDVSSLAVLAAAFTEGWNIVVTAAAGVLGAAVGGGTTAWATSRAESRRLREARSARLYDTRTATYRTLVHKIEAYRGAVMGVQLSRSPAPAPTGDRSTIEELSKAVVADQELRSTLLDVRLVASTAVRKKAISLRDLLVAELTTVKLVEQSDDAHRPEGLTAYADSLAASLERIRASQEELLDAISTELDLDP